MNKVQSKKDQLHKKTHQHAARAESKAHQGVNKTSKKSSDIIHRSIDLAAKAVKNVSESVKKHLSD